MADDILQMKLFYDLGKWMRERGWAEIQARAFRPTGWIIPDDADIGITFGDGEELGAGMMRMDLRDVRQVGRRPLYQLWGPYIEVGLGSGSGGRGLLAPLEPEIKKFMEMLPKWARAKWASDFVVLPGAGLGPVMYGPANLEQRPLEIGDFSSSSWLYFHFGPEAFIQIDFGLMFMVDKSFNLDLIMTLLSGAYGGAIFSMMGHCKAWLPYWGMAFGGGAGGKVAIRFIQTVHMTSKANEVAIL